MSNVWVCGEARAHVFKTMLVMSSRPEDSEESRFSRIVLMISGVHLTSLISAGICEEISGFSQSSIVKSGEKC